MSKVEDGSKFGGEETNWQEYSEPNGPPYHSDPNHLARSIAHQPNHSSMLKKFFRTKGLGGDLTWLVRQKLMRRIRRP